VVTVAGIAQAQEVSGPNNAARQPYNGAIVVATAASIRPHSNLCAPDVRDSSMFVMVIKFVIVLANVAMLHAMA